MQRGGAASHEEGAGERTQRAPKSRYATASADFTCRTEFRGRQTVGHRVRTPVPTGPFNRLLEAAIPFLGPASIVDLLVLTALNRKRGRY
ncbi:hypothetical protein AM571_PB00222 (plasmid) [Rhizobium etli 8C-3]|uniref:Uncharacterized protein n=1 Tax=Rhizobium etli 8C-3 TaxID=538025 RepID=A0A1L5PBG2_RHIET|nr:hypothetical protein AM571_PB00222 [Rhizobium etli 8C-3]